MLESERTLNALLRTVVQRKHLNEIILECLDILLSVSWLSILPKGGVLLAEKGANQLVLVAERNLSPELVTLCGRVPFGHCLCGRAAVLRQLIHANCVDERHDISFEGMGPHGHYNVPILDGDDVVGVLVLYLPHGHASEEGEVRFLKSCADILSLVIRQKQVEQELQDAVESLRHLAHTDGLTELFNRRFLMERLGQEIAQAQRFGRPLSVLMLDADRFKAVNDSYGHSAGDMVLRAISQRLKGAMRSYDIVGRVGGEEFCIVLPNTGADAAFDIAERLRQLIEREEVAIAETQAINVTVSIGVAVLEASDHSDRLLVRADAGLYRAKAAGRNRVEFGTEEVGLRRA